MKNLVKKVEKRDFWRVAKRVMIVAIMVIGFIMPAQVSAQNANRGGEKGRAAMVQRKNDKKVNKKNDKKDNKKADKKKDFNKKNKKAAHKDNKAHKPNVVVVEHHHHKPVAKKRPVVIHHHNNVVHHHCNSHGVAEAATAVIGLAALVALIAN